MTSTPTESRTPRLTPPSGGKIVRLVADNFMRLTAVEITPDGNVVEIRGANAQGKSSVLDAIWHALSYAAAKKGITRPIHDGADSAQVTLEFEQFTVVRTWRSDTDSKLEIFTPEGLKYPSPQKILDDLVGALSFEPFEFATAPSKEQLRMLLEVVDLPFDPDEVARERAEYFERRTVVKRERDALTARLAAMSEPPVDTPEEEVPSSVVLAELDEAVDVQRKHETVAAEIETTKERIQNLRKALADAEADLLKWKGREAELPEIPDVEAIRSRLADLDGVNANVRAKRERDHVRQELDIATKSANSLTASIDELDKAKAEAMAAADLPVPGLGFDEDGVTLGGLPFAQASHAEKMKTSIAVAMALNPEIRVIRIENGESLDSASLALVHEMAEAHDCQVWMEVVSEDGTTGVLIEDGAIA